jgi:hypothetical protein
LAVFTLALPVVAQDDEEPLTIALNEYMGSGVSGWATLTPSGSGIRVEMAVEGEAVTGDHPTHIHTGTCTDFDPNPTYPLTTVILDPLTADGTSATTVEDVTLTDLLAADHVILVHKSTEELTNYFVCGDIKQSNAIAPPTTGSAGSVAAPSTGVGTAAITGPGYGPQLAALGALSILLATTGLLLRRSVGRG